MYIFLHGGLGNQLFQLSIAHSLSKRVAVILSSAHLLDGNRKCQIANAADHLGLSISSELCPKGHATTTGITDLAEAQKQCCAFYFPSAIDWASHCVEKSEFLGAVESLIPSPLMHRVVSRTYIHLRLGDYLWPRAAGRYGVLRESYFEKCRILLQDGRTEFAILAEDDRAVKRLYPSLARDVPSITASSSVFADLDLLASGGGIIAANSSLSQWAAWLGMQRYEDFKVLFPSPMQPDSRNVEFVEARGVDAEFWNPFALALKHPWVLTRRLKWQDSWWI